ncbi:hypothetical protein D3C72_1340790 [compost metagenome]
MQSCVVVFHLVVVPGHDPGAVGVHRLQVRVAFVQRVAVAVVLQAAWVGQRLQARQLGEQCLGFCVGGVGLGGCIFVDVVAQKDHQVRIVRSRMAPGSVVAVLPALARGKHEPHALHGCAIGWGGACAADGAGLAIAVKAVVVPTVGRKAACQHVYAVAPTRCGQRFAFLHDMLELRVVRNFPLYGLRCKQGQLWAGQEPRPQHHAVAGGLATGYAQAKELLADRPGCNRQGGMAGK